MSSGSTTFGILYIFKSSLWIAVLIVRVGCIIEAQAHPSNSYSTATITSPYTDGNLQSRDVKPEATTVSSISGRSKKVKSLQQFQDEDTCSGKKDGYYQNFGSGCSSYYFCAAGYQISYVCPPNTHFNGDRCIKGYKCPINPETLIYSNPCSNLSNGYYPMKHNPQKYFYCYHKSKVIDLSCSDGKIYSANSKSCLTRTTTSQVDEDDEYSKFIESEKEMNCVNKSNGFYTVLSSNCNKYFYCIQGEKTVLECQTNFVFDGSLCVLRSRFACPNPNTKRLS